MEIGVNICKSKNFILPDMKIFNFRYLKKYSSDMKECSHRGGTCDGQPTSKFWINVNKKVDIYSPLISPFVILTIRGPQNAGAQRVSDQNVQKQRKNSPIPFLLLSSPTKNITSLRTAIFCSLPNFVENVVNRRKIMVGSMPIGLIRRNDVFQRSYICRHVSFQMLSIDPTSHKWQQPHVSLRQNGHGKWTASALLMTSEQQPAAIQHLCLADTVQRRSAQTTLPISQLSKVQTQNRQQDRLEIHQLKVTILP
jgi:hypothetical protein